MPAMKAMHTRESSNLRIEETPETVRNGADANGTVKKKIIVDDPDPPAKGTPVAPGGGTTPDARLDELDRAAADAKHPAVKKLLASFAAPFDKVTEKGNSVERVKPIPLLWGK